MEKGTPTPSKKDVSSFTPTREEKAVFKSGEAARAALTGEVARQQGDTAAANRLHQSAAQKAQEALDILKG